MPRPRETGGVATRTAARSAATSPTRRPRRIRRRRCSSTTPSSSLCRAGLAAAAVRRVSHRLQADGSRARRADRRDPAATPDGVRRPLLSQGRHAARAGRSPRCVSPRGVIEIEQGTMAMCAFAFGSVAPTVVRAGTPRPRFTGQALDRDTVAGGEMLPWNRHRADRRHPFHVPLPDVVARQLLLDFLLDLRRPAAISCLDVARPARRVRRSDESGGGFSRPSDAQVHRGHGLQERPGLRARFWSSIGLACSSVSDAVDRSLLVRSPDSVEPGGPVSSRGWAVRRHVQSIGASSWRAPRSSLQPMRRPSGPLSFRMVPRRQGQILHQRCCSQVRARRRLERLAWLRLQAEGMRGHLPAKGGLLG